MITIGSLPGGRYRFGIWRGGINWTRRNGDFVAFRPPWNRPLFSERHGINVRHVMRWRGWRLFIRKDYL